MDLRLRIVFYRMPAHSYGMSCAEMRGALPPLVGFRPHTERGGQVLLKGRSYSQHIEFDDDIDVALQALVR